MTLSVMCAASGTFRDKMKCRDNMRVKNWKIIVDDLREPFVAEKAYPHTGFGLGSFKFRYHAKHPSPGMGHFFEAHNEHMELLHDTGMIGWGLFFVALIAYFKSIKIGFIINKYLLSSVMCSMIAAGAMFGWHLGTIAFYTVLLMGLLDRKRSLL